MSAKLLTSFGVPENLGASARGGQRPMLLERFALDDTMSDFKSDFAGSAAAWSRFKRVQGQIVVRMRCTCDGANVRTQVRTSEACDEVRTVLYDHQWGMGPAYQGKATTTSEPSLTDGAGLRKLTAQNRAANTAGCRFWERDPEPVFSGAVFYMEIKYFFDNKYIYHLSTCNGRKNAERKVLMKRTVLILIMLIPPLAPAHGFFKSGNDLLLLSDAADRVNRRAVREGDFQDSSMLFGYVMGVVDAEALSPRCVPEDATVKQLVAISAKYIRERPAEWNKDGAPLILRAMYEAFSCKK